MKTSDMPQRKFKVTGLALIPVEVAITVEAVDEVNALAKAIGIFESSKRKRQFVVPNSEDDGAVHAFEPSEATPL